MAVAPFPGTEHRLGRERVRLASVLDGTLGLGVAERRRRPREPRNGTPELLHQTSGARHLLVRDPNDAVDAAPNAGQRNVRNGLSAPDKPVSRPSLRSEEHTSELQSLMRISYA